MHNKALRRVKLTANSIPAGDVILLQSVLLCPFFGLANFAGLFSFQLLTFVCRTPFCPNISRQKTKAGVRPPQLLEEYPHLPPWQKGRLFYLTSVSISRASGRTDGPMTICTSPSARRSTPAAPAARRPASSTAAGSRRRRRKRVMQCPMESTLSRPPSASSTAAAHTAAPVSDNGTVSLTGFPAGTSRVQLLPLPRPRPRWSA